MSITGKIRTWRAKRHALKRKEQGHKPHTCDQCGKKLGMGEFRIVNGGYLYCKSHGRG